MREIDRDKEGEKERVSESEREREREGEREERRIIVFFLKINSCYQIQCYYMGWTIPPTSAAIS